MRKMGLVAAGRRAGGIALVILAAASLPACGRRDELLRRAAIGGNREAVQELLGAGADPSYRTYDWTILMGVARAGHAAIAEMLIDQGADVNVVSRDGNSPLMIAAAYGHVGVVRVLLAQGAEVNRRNARGNTALMHAAEFGHREVVELLLQAGADVRVRDHDGETALNAARRRGYADIVKLLETAGDEVRRVKGDATRHGRSVPGRHLGGSRRGPLR
jgi:uncharacterized protein